jgi:hypothetical protein
MKESVDVDDDDYMPDRWVANFDQLAATWHQRSSVRQGI